MPFVKRNKHGAVIAVSQEKSRKFVEELPDDDLELGGFLSGVGGNSVSLSATDQDFVRVLEDVVELLIAKGVILFTDLPDSAQQKIMRRQQLRTELGDKLDLLGDD